MTYTPEQLHEAEALAVRECRKMAAAFSPCSPVIGHECSTMNRCQEKADRVADDCPFMAQAKLALFGWVEP